MSDTAYLRYLNRNATRNLPLSPQLTSALGFLPELGVTAEVFSGGQPEKGSGGARVGSVRHDHGDAADVFFVKDGRRLDWANPEDRPVFEEIVQRGKASGLTGFGAGPGYMQAGSMHVGFGSPGVWGAGGKSAAAPDWLVAAYEGAPAPDPTQMASSGDTSLAGGAGDDTLAQSYTPPNNPGGLGGLGGFLQSEGFGDWLSAAGASMMSSPSNNWFANMDTALQNRQTARFRKEALEESRAEKAADRQAMETVLRSQGFNAEEARAYAGNTSAANLAIAGREKTIAQQRGNKTAAWLAPQHPDIAEAILNETITGAEGLKMAEDRKKYMQDAPSGYRRSGDGTGLEFIPGGPADPSVARSLKGDGTAGNAPSGFRWLDPANPNAGLEPIPGGPGEQIGGENAGRIGIAQSFLKDLPSIRESVAKGDITGVWDASFGKMGFGEQGRLYARVESGADALQRMLSGAGMPESEAQEYARRYKPNATDSADIVAQKLNQLERELTSQMDIVMRGRGGRPGAAGAASPPRPPSGTATSGVKWSVE